MSRAFLLLKFLLVGIPLTGSAQMPRPSQDAATLLDRTIARMGGDSALRGIRSLRLDMMTQWARTTSTIAVAGPPPRNWRVLRHARVV